MRNWLLPSILTLLALLSLLTLRSIAPSLVARQFVFFVLGLSLFVFFSKISINFLSNWHFVGYALVCVLLVIPLLLETVTRGIKGWIFFGDLFALQPVQLAIPVIGLTVATWSAEKNLRHIPNLTKLIAMITFPAALMIAEPEIGMTVVYLLSLASVIFLSKTNTRHLASLALLSIAAVVISWTFILRDDQQKRITSFFNQDQETLSATYNARQSLIAVGSGKFFGRGLGQGVQSHLRFLPERQTDFIFASLAEELGFIGSSLVITLYAGLTFVCVKTALDSNNKVMRYYCFIAASMVTVQAGINIGMNMGLAPITGITLPFLSYGGSSILSLAILFGIIENIANQTQDRKALHFT